MDQLPAKYIKLISEFREIDCDNNISQHSKQEIVIHNCISKILNKIYKKSSNFYNFSKIEILEHWSKIVGENFSTYCQPEKLHNETTLVIKTKNPIIKQELSMRKHEILKKIKTLFIKSPIKEIRVI